MHSILLIQYQKIVDHMHRIYLYLNRDLIKPQAFGFTYTITEAYQTTNIQIYLYNNRDLIEPQASDLYLHLTKTQRNLTSNFK